MQAGIHLEHLKLITPYGEGFAALPSEHDFTGRFRKPSPHSAFFASLTRNPSSRIVLNSFLKHSKIS